MVRVHSGLPNNSLNRARLKKLFGGKKTEPIKERWMEAASIQTLCPWDLLRLLATYCLLSGSYSRIKGI
jgi:hypothetical protein